MIEELIHKYIFHGKHWDFIRGYYVQWYNQEFFIEDKEKEKMIFYFNWYAKKEIFKMRLINLFNLGQHPYHRNEHQKKWIKRLRLE